MAPLKSSMSVWLRSSQFSHAPIPNSFATPKALLAFTGVYTISGNLLFLNQNGYHTGHFKQSCASRKRRAGRDEKHTEGNKSTERRSHSGSPDDSFSFLVATHTTPPMAP